MKTCGRGLGLLNVTPTSRQNEHFQLNVICNDLQLSHTSSVLWEIANHAGRYTLTTDETVDNAAPGLFLLFSATRVTSNANDPGSRRALKPQSTDTRQRTWVTCGRVSECFCFCCSQIHVQGSGRSARESECEGGRDGQVA